MSFRYACVLLFVLCCASASAATFTVTNTNDSGPGSLRQAMLDANAAAQWYAPATVAFNITTSSKRIAISSALPQQVDYVTIDGTTQAGYSGRPLVEIDGTNAPANGFTACLGGAGTFKALAVGNCRGPAVALRGGTLTASYVGLDASGTVAWPNTTGVLAHPKITGISGSPWENVITNNVIAASTDAGVDIFDHPAVVTGNWIGVDATGERAVPNGIGVRVDEYQVTIGGNSPADRNYICGNPIGIAAWLATVTIAGNSVGVTPGGKLLGNTVGIWVRNGSARIGDPGVLAPNVIAGGVTGVVINEFDSYTGTYSSHTSVRGNAIYSNSGLGIDIATLPKFGPPLADGVTPNDTGDADVGPNELQNFPTNVRGRVTAGGVTISGALNSVPSRQYTVDLYANVSCSASGYGEGATYLTSVTVTTDASGNGTFSTSVSSPLAVGTVITATATSPSGSTSEFSPCGVVGGAGGTFRFNSATASVSEAGPAASLTVLRTDGATGVVSVGYATAGGTATSGSDFTATTGTLTFADGQTSATITVPILQDSIYEGPENFTITLSNPTGGANLGDPSTATVTIIDDDPPPAVSADDIRIVEGNAGQRPVSIVLTASSPITGTVSYTTSDGTAKAGSDYVATSGSVSFANETTKTIAVPIIGDSVVEADETFTVQLTAAGPFTLTKSSVTVTIVNDDAGVSTTPLAIAPGTTGNIAVNLGSSDVQTLTVSSSNPDVASVPATVAINGAGNVPVTGKSAGHATITVTLPPSLGGTSTRVEVDVFQPAHLVLAPEAVRVAAGGSVTISARFDPALDTAETVPLSTSGTGKVSIPASITIAAGSNSSTFTITGVEPGRLLVLATLTAAHGSSVTAIDVTVTDATTQPSLASVSPANGPIAGGTAVTLSGSNLRGDCTVRFGGVAATNVAFAGPTTITATTPAHAAGAADVTIACGTDTSTLTNGFTYLGASPHLSAVAPSFGSTSGGTVVSISGDNLTSGCWPFFDGVAARSATVVDSTRLVASTPPHAAATDVTILVRCNGSAPATLAKAFSYTTADEPSPVVTEVNPLSGTVGRAVTVSGARFRDTDVVTFDGVRATVLSTDFETHVVRVPEVPPGKVSVTVTDIAGRASTSGPIFTVVAAQTPQITAATPRTVRPLNEVVVDGSGFRPGYSFTIGDVTAAVLELSYTRVTLRVPALAAGTYDLRIVDAAGSVAAAGPPLTILATGLDVERVTPLCTSNAGGTLMTITGNGFAAGATVTIGGAVAGGVTFVDAHTLTVPLPSSVATGWPAVVVRNANGDAASLSRAFMTASPFDPNGCARPRPSHR